MSNDKNAILQSFGAVTKRAEEYNRKKGTKRYHIMTHGRRDKITEIGIYDSNTKKYVLTDVRAHDANDVLKEMSRFIA